MAWRRGFRQGSNTPSGIAWPGIPLPHATIQPVNLSPSTYGSTQVGTAPVDAQGRPYFLWWTNISLDDFQHKLASPGPDERAYWMGALLREANTRHVWQFVTLDGVCAAWPRLIRYLGRSRGMWAYLLQMEEPTWPPAEARSG